MTIEERFRLRIRAFARRDLVDCERLDRACPGREYQAYCARIDASDSLTLCALVDMMPKLAKLQMLAAIRPMADYLEAAGHEAGWMGLLDGYSAGWQASGRRGGPPDVSDDDLTAAAERAYTVGARFSDVLTQIAESLAASARTTRDGLAAFATDELGLSLDVLLGAWGREALTSLAVHAEALDAAEPDADELALFVRILDLAWRRHALMDSTAEADDELKVAIEAAGWPSA